MKPRLLIVEDDPVLGSLIQDFFEREEWDSCLAQDGEMGLELFEEQSYDLILLDVMLPKKDGFTVCKKIRESSDVPIFFITARVLEEDELHGYSLGADDYITKPFSLPVLYAKATTLMKRLRGNESLRILKKGNIEIDLGTKQVVIAGEFCHLPKLQYEILLYLLENPNRILTRDQILIRFWGYDFEGNERVVDTHIKKLRKAIAGSDCKITTVHKAGYRMEVPV
ncbi:MAG: response regulator transcription factor [Lachnospiraceae bacterium]|nr:response regulator transcription factor [Lachnospiraceae bacterium]